MSMSMEIDFVVERLPPTDNNAYRTGDGGRRYLTSNASAWKAAVTAALLASSTLEQRVAIRRSLGYEVELRFYLRTQTQKGEQRRWDTSSHQKLTVDAVAETLKIDDSYITKQVIEKHERRVATQDQTVVVIRSHRG